MPETRAKRRPARPNAKYLKKDPSPVHEGCAAFITKTTGHEVSAGDVALIQRLYPLYLRSPEVVAAREAEKAEREKAARAKEDAKKERAQKRLDAINAQRERLLKELGLAPDDPMSGPSLSVVENDDEDETKEEDEGATLVLDESEDDFEEGEVEETEADEDEDDDEEWDDEDEDEEDF